MSILSTIELLNEGNPMPLTDKNGHIFTVSPSTAKKGRAYRTKEFVPLTKYEKEMPGVVVGQNRGMIFSSCRPINGKYLIPTLEEINFIIVDEESRKLFPVDDAENKIAWVGQGEHSVKDVIGDGQGQHSFCDTEGHLAVDLWFKWARMGYGVKGVIQPVLPTDIGTKVIDHWGVERTITLGNTVVLNSSLVKGLGAYESLEDFIAHGKEWGLTELMKQWQSGDHKPEKERIVGVQAQGTNLTQTRDDIRSLLKPEARKIWASKFEQIAWMNQANINTTRGRAFAARPSMIYKELVKNQINTQATTNFLRIARGQVKVEAQYLKMFQDKLVWSLVYIHGMAPNEAAKKAAETGLHGEIRVNPSYAGLHIIKDDNGKGRPFYTKETFIDGKGRYVKVALVRYPHGAPSETIIVKAYLDATVPADVIMFPAPVANDDGTVPVRILYAFRLQGADFDGDAVTAFSEKIWVEAQERNTGKPYMIIPVNTESTEKDKTKVTDETWETFCQEKVDSLSNQVGLIATSLKYFFSQKANMIRNANKDDISTIVDMITSHACAMGDDIDEFKHGKAKNTIVPFIVPGKDGEKDETLYAPYFMRYTKKFKTEEDFDKAIYMKTGEEKKPGSGVLDTYAEMTEALMKECKLDITKEVSKASDGKDRYYFGVNPAKWETKNVELFAAESGIGQVSVALPIELEKVFNIPHGICMSAKDLFVTLYKSHAEMCKALISTDQDDDRSSLIKALDRINEHYALAKVAIVAWTKAMMKVKAEKDPKINTDINGEEAMKIFATIMTQHTTKARSAIEVLTETGLFRKPNGETYEKTVFSASRTFNYFLDVCGDGLLLQKIEEPNFPPVSEKIINAAKVVMPDLDKAEQKARKELALINRIAETLSFEEIKEVTEEDESYVPEDSMWLSSDEGAANIW